MADRMYGVIGGICTGVALATIRYSYREEGLLRRLRMETNRADTWRRNYCYLQAQLDRELAAERAAAVDEATAIVLAARKEAA